MRELCANTIYKFVNRFSFDAQESLTLAVKKTSFFLVILLLNQLVANKTRLQRDV